MSSETEITILLYGLGAVGGTFAFFLSRCPNVKLDVVARSNYEVVKKEGMKIKSLNKGEHSFTARNVYSSTKEAAGTTYDFVICAHKALHQSAAVEDLAPAIGPSTTILIAQNGIGNEDPFRARYPGSTIISAVIWISASQPAPGEFVTTSREHIDLGLFPNPNLDASLEQKRIETIVSLFTEGGMSVSHQEDVQITKWEKVICNIVWNPVAAITGQPVAGPFFDSSDEADAFVKALILDVIAVGRRAGIPLGDALADKSLGFVKGLEDFVPSMLTDLRNGVPLELDVIIGTPIRMAREFGMSVPTLRAVYVLVTRINQKLTAEARA